MFLDRSSLNWFSPYIRYYTSSWSSWNAMTALSSGSNYYKYDIPSGTSKVQFDHTGNYYDSGECATEELALKKEDGFKNCYKILTQPKGGQHITGSHGYYGFQYTVKYNNNGGSGTISNSTVYYDNATLSDGTGFSKTDYKLMSWNTLANGTGASYVLGSYHGRSATLTYKAGATVNLYAQWEAYVDPASSTNSFYVYDPHNVLGNTFANINVYGFGETGAVRPMSWPGIHTGISQVTLGRTSMYQVALSTSYPNFIMNCGNGQNQTVNITDLSSNLGKVLVIDNTHNDKTYDTHWDNADIYSDVPATDGYYLLGNDAFVAATGGSGTEWKYASGVKMNTLSGESNKANYVLTVDRTVIFRARSYLSSTDSWLNFGASYSSDGITTSGDNVQVVAGTYSIYVNGSSQVFVSKGLPLDAFCSTFITDINNVCDAVTGNTDPSDLSSTWSTLSSLYSQLTAAAKKEISDIGFNGGSDVDDPHKVVKAYKYIVTKYGTTVCPDFIWGQTISPSGANKINIDNSVSNNSVMYIVIATATVSLVALGAFFLLRRKKHN